ncbi:MAG: hypothetical protein JO008_14990 [Alphaproteobacteria bacterium]|nr:hypothetical protein [Alphaproteobacteria bacterium]
MGAVTVGAVAFVVIFAGAVFGVLIRGILPERHLSPDSRDVVKLTIAVVATMSALVVSLMITSAKGAFDTRRDEVVKMSADFVILDGMLAHFGAEGQPAREAPRRVATEELNHIREGDAEVRALSREKVSQDLHERIHQLVPQTDAQRSAQAQALRTFTDLRQTHWLLFEQPESTIPAAFLILLVFWLAIIFASFGLFAPPNSIVFGTFFVCALSLAAAIALIVELDQSFSGLIRISLDPLQHAIDLIGA